MGASCTLGRDSLVDPTGGAGGGVEAWAAVARRHVRAGQPHGAYCEFLVSESHPLDRRDVEFVVVGAGLLGLSTAWHLMRRGRDVLVLERAQVGHPGAGSRGLCRIFRLGYDDPRYVVMAQQALPLWRELEADTGYSLLRTTGQLTFGPNLDALSEDSPQRAPISNGGPRRRRAATFPLWRRPGRPCLSPAPVSSMPSKP
jgi:hypothetical protein